MAEVVVVFCGDWHERYHHLFGFKLNELAVFFSKFIGWSHHSITSKLAAINVSGQFVAGAMVSIVMVISTENFHPNLT